MDQIKEKTFYFTKLKKDKIKETISTKLKKKILSNSKSWVKLKYFDEIKETISNKQKKYDKIKETISTKFKKKLSKLKFKI